MAPWSGVRWHRSRLDAAHRHGIRYRWRLSQGFDRRLLAIHHDCTTEVPDIHEPQQVGQHRFRAPVFIEAVRMQAVAAAPGFEIDQRHAKVIAPEKPIERPRGARQPLGLLIDTPSSEAGRNRRGGFEGLLVVCTGR